MLTSELRCWYRPNRLIIMLQQLHDDYRIYLFVLPVHL